jgi:outer membrane protein OmpA-like peptidoglycan-associated protein
MTGRRRYTFAALLCLSLGALDVAALNLRLFPRALAVNEGKREQPLGRAGRVGSPPAQKRPHPVEAAPPAGPGAAASIKDAPPPAPLTVGFATNQDRLDGADAQLDQLAAFVRQHPGLLVMVDGHADWRGAEAHNRALSLRRAQAVAARLAQAGIPGAVLSIRGHGSAQALDPGKGPAAWGKNRRVEVRWQKGAP